MELFIANRAVVQQVLVLLLFLLSCWKGGGPERACSSVLLAMVVAQLLFRKVAGFSQDFSGMDLWSFALDSFGLVVFVAVALKANRFYPLALAAAQLVAFSSHLASWLVEPVTSLAYYLLYAMPFWFQILILAGGLGRHAYRSTALGRYRDWRPVPPLNARAGYS